MKHSVNRFRLNPAVALNVFIGLTAILCVKILWGYWARDLTFGDTSSYFRNAVIWAEARQVNIVWSPLYTAFFGTCWELLQDAIAATLVHRLILIGIIGALVTWLALLTLPRLLALVLIVWWIALPIHYDTLYEVHLFGALPLIAMAIVPFIFPERWHYPLWIGLAAISTILIRNEYVIILAVVGVFLLVHAFRSSRRLPGDELRPTLFRYGAVLAFVTVLVSGFYSVSYIKGDAVAEVSKPKHTLNMCQVFAFGYQQRHPAWTSSPWTECHGLMQETFGAPLPTLREMVIANPLAVAEHFWWNLSLAPAGIEMLLFNATSSKDNPDYAPSPVIPIWPHVVLALFASIGILGLYRVARGKTPESIATRKLIRSALPVLIGATLTVFAVILTQRPRPSYLLGFGILLVWLWLVALTALLPSLKKFDGTYIPLVLLIIVIIVVPSYSALSLPSKQGILGFIYAEAKPHTKALCQPGGTLGLGDYTTELHYYLCSPQLRRAGGPANNFLALHSFPEEARGAPNRFVAELKKQNVQAIIVDPYLVRKNPGLKSCEALREAFLSSGWTLLSYRDQGAGNCSAIYQLVK